MYHNRLQLLKSPIIIKVYKKHKILFCRNYSTDICLNKGNSNDRKISVFNIFSIHIGIPPLRYSRGNGYHCIWYLHI